ncbi:MAG: hypothetical protein GX431_11405 [Bacteroidales bacterium]|jgi:hypothetical protein|nr:hypothetical protein [Bacteroidales bacterium]
MKISRITGLLAFQMVLILNSCYYDSEEALYPSVGLQCDTVNVTFSGTVTGMLANSCLSCHSNTTAAASGNGIRLQDYADVKARATSIAGAIKHSGGYSPMPKNGGQLKACPISQFDVWIKNGMPNN